MTEFYRYNGTPINDLTPYYGNLDWELSARLQEEYNKRLNEQPKQIGGTHYSSMKIEPIEFIVGNNIPYREANVIKYVCRHKNKNGKEDILKAMHYLEMILKEYD